MTRLARLQTIIKSTAPAKITAYGLRGYEQMMSDRASYRNQRAQALWSAAGLS